MRRLLAVVLATLVVAGCGADDVDPDTARLRRADAELQNRPRDRFAMAEVIRVAAAGAGNRVDPGGGRYRREARPFLDRAAAVWPRYLAATGGNPQVSIASLMVGVYGDGLMRPADAARAARLVARARPSAAAYLSLADWSARAGDRQAAEQAAQTALELAEPHERARVRAAIRLFSDGNG